MIIIIYDVIYVVRIRYIQYIYRWDSEHRA